MRDIVHRMKAKFSVSMCYFYCLVCAIRMVVSKDLIGSSSYRDCDFR